jgi:hypothetical protein
MKDEHEDIEEGEQDLSEGTQETVEEKPEETEHIEDDYEEAILKREWGRFYGSVIKSLTPDDSEALKKYMKRHNLTFKELILQLIDDVIHPKPMSIAQINEALDQAIALNEKLKKMGIGGINLSPEMVEAVIGKGEGGSDMMSSIFKPMAEAMAEMIKMQMSQMLGQMKAQMKSQMIKSSIQEEENVKQ